MVGGADGVATTSGVWDFSGVYAYSEYVADGGVLVSGAVSVDIDGVHTSSGLVSY